MIKGLLRVRPSPELGIGLVVGSLLTYYAVKDSRVVNDQLNSRTKGPEMAGLGASVGMLAGGIFGGRSAIVGGVIGAIGGFNVGEAMHGGMPPEVAIAASASLGISTLVLGSAISVSTNKFLNTYPDFIKNMKGNLIAALDNSPLKTLAPALDGLRLSRSSFIRIMTGLAVVGAARAVEVRSIRNARNIQTFMGSAAGATMTPEEYSNHIINEDNKNDTRPLIRVKGITEPTIDRNRLAEAFR